MIAFLSLLPVPRSLLALVLVGAVVRLAAAQPPIESSLGHAPVPAIVAMSGPEPPAPDPDFYRWALTQGGLTLVCLVLVGALYRELTAVKNDKKLLIDLVEKNTLAHAAGADANNRLARALEHKGVF